MTVRQQIRAGSRAPRHSANQRRRCSLTVAVDEWEKERIRVLAAQTGMSMSAWLRTKGLEQPVSARMDRQAICELTRAIGRVCNNLNELARTDTDGLAASAEACLTELRDLLTKAQNSFDSTTRRA